MSDKAFIKITPSEQPNRFDIQYDGFTNNGYTKEEVVERVKKFVGIEDLNRYTYENVRCAIWLLREKNIITVNNEEQLINKLNKRFGI